MYLTKAVIFVCRSKTLTSCSVTHCKNKMLMWHLIKIKKAKQHVINFLKNPVASLVYAVTLQHLKVRKTQSCQTANWHFLFLHERWAEETQTQWETLSLLCTIISTRTNKRTRKKHCVWADTHNSLLSSLQDFPTIIHSKWKRERPCGRRTAGFQARSWGNPFQWVQWEY